MATASNKQKVYAEIARLAKLTKELGYEVPQVTKVQFSSVGRNAGWCKGRMLGTPSFVCTIQIHGGLLDEHGDQFVKEIVGHEYAHAVAQRNWKQCQGHGPVWKRIMNEFGLVPERCHKYEVSQYKKKRSNIIVLACAKKSFTVTEKRLMRSLSMKCPCCKTSLAVVGRETQVDDNDIERVRAASDFSDRNLVVATRTQVLGGRPVSFPTTRAASTPSRSTDRITGGTKKFRAESIVRAMHQAGISEPAAYVNRLANELNMGIAGARTYYYNAKKALGI